MKNSNLQLQELLDEGYSLNLSAPAIWSGKKPISNFIPVVAKVERPINASTDQSRIHIDFHFDDGRTETICIASNTLQDTRKSFFPSTAIVNGKSGTIIRNFIKRQVRCAEVTPVQIVHSGWNLLSEHQPVYMLGNVPCGLSDSMPALECTDATPAVRPSDENALQNTMHLWHFCKLSQYTAPLLLLGTAAGLLSSLLHDAGFSTLVLFVYGNSSSFKTSTCKLFTSVCGKDENIISLASSEAAIRTFASSHRDVPIVIDDMGKSDSKSVVKRREETVSNYCQSLVDSGKLYLRNGKQACEISFQGSVIFTAEYVLENISTRNRLIEVPMDEISSSDLQRCQALEKDHRVMETFAFHFTNYVTTHMEDVISRLESGFQDDQYDLFKKQNEVKSAYRVNQNLRMLHAVASVLEHYFVTSVQLDTQKIQGWAKRFHSAIHDICADQLHDIARAEDILPDCDYLFAFYEVTQQLYGGYICLPRGYHRYKKECKKYFDGDPDAPYAFISDDSEDILCITGKKITELLSPVLPNFSLKAFSEQLKDFGLLKIGADKKCSLKIPGTNKRFYHIKIKNLEEIYNEQQRRRNEYV